MPEGDTGPILLKLGGSLITDKLERESARLDVLERIAAEVAACREIWSPRGLIVGHGSGSYGHFAAAGTALSAGARDRRDGGLRRAAALTQDAAARLHRIVARCLLGAGLEVFSLPPSGWMTLDRGAAASAQTGAVEGALDLGMVPVVHGDVVVDHSLGMCIASTEKVFHILAQRLGEAGRTPSLALWLGETDGIHDSEGRTVPAVSRSNVETVRQSAGASAGVDVTGGMRLRLETAWELASAGVPSWIGDGRRPGSVEAAIAGRAKGGTSVLISADGFEPVEE